MTTSTTDIILPKFDGLTFDEVPHIYRLDGREIPSVSTIMEPLRAFHYAGISEKTLEKTADKGTAVHNAIENWLKFDFIDISSEHRSYFDAFLDWFKYRNPTVIASEIRLYHNILSYAGTCDLLCKIDGKIILVDYKTTFAVSEMLCGVQLEAYSQALSSHKFQIDGKMILQLKRDASWKEYQFPANDAQRWRVFGACKTVHDYVKSVA